VRDDGGRVRCSLWALGGVVEDHLRLDPDGTSVEVIAPPPIVRPPRPLPPAVGAGVAAAAAAFSAGPLARFVRESGGRCELWWTALDGQLVAAERDRLGVSYALREALHRRLRDASTRADRLAVALAALTELAHLFGDPLRARAQTHLASLPADLQADALARPEASDASADDARRIAGAVEALLADVEGGEGGRAGA
jgi:hypothetical protein